MNPIRVAFVVQRYGLEVNGGSEFLCRLIAERMRPFWNLEVLSTCALDYMSWENFYPAGVTEVNQVRVRRFPVDFPRTPLIFNRLSQKVLTAPSSTDLQKQWAREQGPYSSEFLRYLNENADRYDVFYFFTYLYGLTFFGIQSVSNKSILVPTAHDEPPFHLPIYQPIFKCPMALFFQTPEEKDLVTGKIHPGLPSEVVSVGIDDPQTILSKDISGVEQNWLKKPYLFYLGRIDESKGCRELIEYFIQFKEKNPTSEVRLLLAGKAAMTIPHHPDLLALGFIEEKQKSILLSHAVGLVMPSIYESLSLVTLEAWSYGTPVLLNSRSLVLLGHAERSGGALLYKNLEEFGEGLASLLNDRKLRVVLGNKGRDYVRKNYSWTHVEDTYKKWANKIKDSL